MDIVLIKRGSNEWEYIWKHIETHPLNEGLEQPRIALHEGYRWEYMESYRENNKVIHRVRHFMHPKYNRIEILVFNGSKDFNEEDIQKKIRINN